MTVICRNSRLTDSARSDGVQVEQMQASMDAQRAHIEKQAAAMTELQNAHASGLHQLEVCLAPADPSLVIARVHGKCHADGICR